MTLFWNAALRTVLPALGGLLGACVLSVAMLTLFLSGPVRVDGMTLTIALRISAWAFLGGVIPTLVYGVPLYAMASMHRAANYRTVLLIGLVPGAVIVPIDAMTGFLVMLFCATVALFTHAIATNVHRSTPSETPGR